MGITNQIVEELEEFVRKFKKTDDEHWIPEYDVPFGSGQYFKISMAITHCADKLINTAKSARINARENAFYSILKEELVSLNKLDYDTNEREMICDRFQELATIVGVDLRFDLTEWLYGSIIANLVKANKNHVEVKEIEIVRQPCVKCNQSLESCILEKTQGIPDYNWYIVRCIKCKEVNLLSIGPNVKEFRAMNYEIIELLRKDYYTEAQANLKLKQLIKPID